MKINVSEIVAEARKFDLAEGQALYLVDGALELGRDGCQPSNSICVAVGPADDVDWADVAEAIEESAAARGYEVIA